MENVSSARPTGKFPEKVENLKGRPVFPVGTFRTEFRVPFTHFNSAAILVSRRVTSSAPYRNLRSNATTFHLLENPGCVRLGNPDLDFQTLNPDFPIEREIRKRISPPRNPSSGWISIKKSKSGFRGFPFYRSIGKSEKGFAKLFSWTVVFFLLSMRARARALFLRTVFQILFRIS